MKKLSKISNGVKKIFLISFLGSFLLFPITILAGTYLMSDGTEVTFNGFVPCGKSQAGLDESPQVTMPCQLCHILVLFNEVLNFIFFTIVPPLAILMVVIGGFMYMFAGGNPSNLNRARDILKATGIALLIIYGAWVVVSFILTFPGLLNPDFEGWKPSEWFKIDCPITP
jgi:hypothetical protein